MGHTTKSSLIEQIPHVQLKTLYLTAVAVAFVYIFTGVATWYYPPTYLPNSKLWAVLFVVAGIGAILFSWFRTTKLAIISGTLLVSGALFRAGALLIDLGLRDSFQVIRGNSDNPAAASYLVAGLVWILVALLLWVGWPAIGARIIQDKREK